MKKTKSMLLFVIILMAAMVVQVYAINTPYICEPCDTCLCTETQLVSHMATHGVDILVNGTLIYRPYQPLVFTPYQPVGCYVCPVTGECFLTEPMMYNHFNHIGYEP